MTLPVTVLARAPERGRVKTRLAAVVGEDEALALHEALLLDVLGRVCAWAGGAGRVVLALTGSPAAMARARGLVESLGRPGEPAPTPVPAIEEQSPGDLGARIEEALVRRALEADCPASLVVGSDCPFLTDSLLDAAVAGSPLGRIHLVPALDGGFVLIGGRALSPGTLAGIDWGSDRVLAQSRAALERAGVRFSLGQAESDVDHLDDLVAAGPRLEAAPHLAPRTLAWLRARALRDGGGTGGAHPG